MAFDSFIKIGDIKGESPDAKHKDQIQVMSFSWGVSNQGASSLGGGAGAGRAELHDFHFVKQVDKSSPVLFQQCCTGHHIKETHFVVRKAGGNQQDYFKVKLGDVIITSVRPGGSAHGGDLPMEEVTLNFTTCSIDYCMQKPDGSLDAPVHGGYDAKAQKVV